MTSVFCGSGFANGVVCIFHYLYSHFVFFHVPLRVCDWLWQSSAVQQSLSDKYIYCVESRERENDMLVNWMKANANETVKFHDYTQYGTEDNSTRLSQPCLFSLFVLNVYANWHPYYTLILGFFVLVFLFCMLSSSLLPQTECEKKKKGTEKVRESIKLAKITPQRCFWWMLISRKRIPKADPQWQVWQILKSGVVHNCRCFGVCVFKHLN